MAKKKPALTIKRLLKEARLFAQHESEFPEPSLYGVTDGKAVGTYLEHKFHGHLTATFNYNAGNSASGVDFPELGIDMKVTSIKQPQSSSPFKSARQKIYGLGYSLLVFVYQKTDNPDSQTATLSILHAVFIDRDRTADFQTTKGLRQIIENDGNKEDVIAFILERNLPVDDISASQLADEILKTPPQQGFLTISNALQWRLQYGRVIQEAGNVDGIERVL